MKVKGYIVSYWYQIPGWDEFGKEEMDFVTIKADSVDEAKSIFNEMVKHEQAKRTRASLRFSLVVDSIKEL
jgi:hypothetical protein